MSDLTTLIFLHTITATVLGVMWWDRRHNMDIAAWCCLAAIALLSLGPMWVERLAK